MSKKVALPVINISFLKCYTNSVIRCFIYLFEFHTFVDWTWPTHFIALPYNFSHLKGLQPFVISLTFMRICFQYIYFRGSHYERLIRKFIVGIKRNLFHIIIDITFDFLIPDNTIPWFRIFFANNASAIIYILGGTLNI